LISHITESELLVVCADSQPANNGPQKQQPQKPKPCSGAKGGTPLAYSLTGIFDALAGGPPKLRLDGALSLSLGHV